MKSVIVRLAIQFDIFGEGDSMQKVQDTLAAINSKLQSLQLESSPQMFVNMVDNSDVEIADEEFEEFIPLPYKDHFNRPDSIWSEIRDTDNNIIP